MIRLLDMRNIEKQIFRPLIRGGKLKYIIAQPEFKEIKNGYDFPCYDEVLKSIISTSI